MYPLIYMLSRTVLTFTLFKATRGAASYCFETVERIPEFLRLYECPRCGKWWGVPDEEDFEPTCDNCGTRLKKRFKEYYFDQKKQQKEEDYE